MSDEIREYSIQYTSPLIPNLKDQQASNSLYERGIIPTNFPSSEEQKESYQNFKNVISLDQKFTDDTFFDKNGYATCLEHEEEYQLSRDKNQYDFVSNTENFANIKTVENNLEHAYTFNLATSYNNSMYAQGDFGTGAQNALDMISQYASKNQAKEFNFSNFISDYKEDQKKRNKFGGRSYGNGSVMQNGANIFAAQGFQQGLTLTDTFIHNLYDTDYSRKAARSLFTTGFCANCGLQQETILNIIHFLYYDPNPLEDEKKYKNPEKDRNPNTGKVAICYNGGFLKVDNYNFCTFDMISHRQGKTLDNTEPNELQKIDEEDCNGYVEHNYFTTNALPTAMLVIKICLTSKCAEEAIRKILRAAGDSDTIAAAAMPIIAALFGLPKDLVEKILVRSTQTDIMTFEKPTPENTKYANEEDDLKNIKKFDENGNFIYHNEINKLADKTYGHHYRENAKIEWQLKNIHELMEYLLEQKAHSKAKSKDDLLKYIFKRIRADIDFMLDKNKEYELEKEPDLDITEDEIEQAKQLTEEQTSSDKKAHALRLKYLEAKNKVRIYKHRNATAKFQTKAKNDKLNNLTQENIKNIKTELEKINNLFSQNKNNTDKIEAIEADKYDALNENNCEKEENDTKYIKTETAKKSEGTITEIKTTKGTNNKIIFWTWKKKSLAGAAALVIVAGNVVLFWQLSFTVASLSALGTWALYFFVLWLINRFNGSKPDDKMSTTESKDNKKPIIDPTKEKIKQPLINNQIIDPNQKNNNLN